MVTVTVQSHPAQEFPPRWRAASETGASRQHTPVAAPLDPAAAGSKGKGIMTIKLTYVKGKSGNNGRIIAEANKNGNTGTTGNWPDNAGGIEAARLYCAAARRQGYSVDDKALAKLTTAKAVTA